MTKEEKDKVIEVTMMIDEIFDREHLKLIHVVDICANIMGMAMADMIRNTPKDDVKQFAETAINAIRIIINDHIDGTNIKPMGEA